MYSVLFISSIYPFSMDIGTFKKYWFVLIFLSMSFSIFTFRLKYIRIFFVMSYIYIMFKFKSCIYIPNNTFVDIVNVKTIFFKFKFFFYIKHLVSCQRYLCPMIKDAGSPTNYPYYLPFQLYIVLGHKLSIVKKTN